MKRLLDRADELVADIVLTRRDKHRDDPRYMPRPALGVICLKGRDQSTGALDDLIEKGQVVVLLTESEAPECAYDPQPEAFYRLLNFLTQVRASARKMDGCNFVNLDALAGADTRRPPTDDPRSPPALPG